MSWLLKGFLGVTVISSLSLEGLTAPHVLAGSKVGETLKVTVLFFDFVSIPENVQKLTRIRVAKIFNNAGVELEWAPCSTGEGQMEHYTDCKGSKESDHVFLRILPHARRGMRVEAGGEAILGARIVNVFWDLAQSEASRYAVPLPEMLGLIIAHEIGHLVLGPDSHTPAGIMTAKWRSKDLIAICQGGLNFTRQQSERIQVEVKKHQAQRTSDPSSSVQISDANQQ